MASSQSPADPAQGNPSLSKGGCFSRDRERAVDEREHLRVHDAAAGRLEQRMSQFLLQQAHLREKITEHKALIDRNPTPSPDEIREAYEAHSG